MKALQYYLLALNTSDTFFTQETNKMSKEQSNEIKSTCYSSKGTKVNANIQIQ